MHPASRMNSTADSRLVSSTSPTASSGRPALARPAPEQRDDGRVGLDGRRRAPQQHGVARLQAQPGGVAGHVGTVLVDDADDPEGHPDPRDPQAVGADPAVDHLADRVGQGGHGPEAGGHARDPAGVEPEPVERGGVGSAASRPGPGRRRWRRAARRPLLDEVGGAAQGLVPGGRRRPGQHAAGRLGTPPELGQGGRGVGRHRSA